MSDKIKKIIIEVATLIGCEVGVRMSALKRSNETNPQWSAILKKDCLAAIKSGVDLLIGNGVSVDLVDTPYNASVVGKGIGINEMKVESFNCDSSARIICLMDIVDGTWNACAGIPFSTSTMLAFTDTSRIIAPQEAIIDDFIVGLIIPIMGDGFYLGIRGYPSKFICWGGQEEELHLTKNTDPLQVRCFIDLFTTQTYSSLEKSIQAVIPIIRKWADFGRFYGAGVELMSLLGRNNIEPAFGGYVAANQKVDNIVSTSIILEGAGVKVSDWQGRPLGHHKLLDRVYVVFGANISLYQDLIEVLSGCDTDTW